MTHRIIRDEFELGKLTLTLAKLKYPFTVHWELGANRSLDQNRLAFQWYREISEQMGDRTPAEVRAECKLTIGVPILRAENDRFRQRYDEIVKPMTYEQKLALMDEPLDLPVTRLMTTKQMQQYLDAIWTTFTAQGVTLTDPDGPNILVAG